MAILGYFSPKTFPRNRAGVCHTSGHTILYHLIYIDIYKTIVKYIYLVIFSKKKIIMVPYILIVRQFD